VIEVGSVKNVGAISYASKVSELLLHIKTKAGIKLDLKSNMHVCISNVNPNI